MDLTPAQVSGASFATVRKGYDPAQVDEFLAQAAMALESAQQQATAMEARARAAVARLQEVASAAPPPTPAPPPVPLPAREPVAPPPTVDEPVPDSDAFRVGTVEAETISRTLVLAQRTADNTVADARSEAERIRSEAQAEADATIDSTRDISARLLDEARTEARRTTETERRAAENEVQALNARRDFLVGDVDQLEQFLAAQRDRLRGAARQIEALCERVPSGLGAMARPALSASDDASEAGRDHRDAVDAERDAELDETVEMVRPVADVDDDDDDDDDVDVDHDDDGVTAIPRVDLSDQDVAEDEAADDLPVRQGRNGSD